MFGENFNLESDDEVLKINSPKKSIDGPYVVVFKSVSERWAIIAMNWNDVPSLGIRWFWEKSGNPMSSSYPTWLVIPSMLLNAILNGLPLEFKFRDKLNRFLAGEISGTQLQNDE
jgi:hypothetical protein